LLRVLKIGKTTFYKLLSDGDLKSFKIGRSRRVPESEVLDYIAAQTAAAA